MGRVEDYKLLLAEVITKDMAIKHLKDGKNVVISEAKSLLKLRQRYLNMPREKREKLLRQHVDKLHQDCVKDYKLLLVEIITKDMVTKHLKNGKNVVISEAKSLLKKRQRYLNMPREERDNLLCQHVDKVHQDCVKDYKLLLAQVITQDMAIRHLKDGKNIVISEAKSLLKPHQRYLCMPPEERESLLRHHVDKLHQDCVKDYKLLLAEVITKDMATKHLKDGKNVVISEAKCLLKSHQRYLRMPREERENLLRHHVDKLHQDCVKDYKLLLTEVVTKDMAIKHLKDSKNVIISEAKCLLKTRQRYLCMPREERENLLRQHVDKLHEKLTAEVIGAAKRLFEPFIGKKAS